MITDLIIQIIGFYAEILIDPLEGTDHEYNTDWTVPTWLSQLSGMAGTLLGAAESMGVWVPWGLFVTVFGAVMASLLTGFGIRLFRIILSTFSGGGGAS